MAAYADQAMSSSRSSSEPSPSERYASFARRASRPPRLEAFVDSLGFPLDEFQVVACEAVEAGEGVLVAAPTGAGKTVVAEFGVYCALSEGRKCFYTTPIKALSNQKYADLVAVHGAQQVGLLTGDTSLNPTAPVVVMTTEVLRNMLYASSDLLEGLGYVVMDEVHYLADRFRGPVWEEVIIHLPASVQVISLSATVSNAEELGDWLDTVRGHTRVVVSEHRPVPLWQHVMTPDGLSDLFVTDDTGASVLNPELAQLGRSSSAAAGRGGRSRGPRGPGRRGYRGGEREAGRGGRRWPDDGPRDDRPRPMSRAQIINRLDADGLLPVITFIFSRAGCEAAVAQCLAAGVRLTTPDERRRIRDIVARRTAGISATDLAALGYDTWLQALSRGLAAHHAGLLATFKEVVEELFSLGLVKAVFATETLALGINMPARTVVLEKLVKYNGEALVPVTPGEYTQLTGRAGRRGIDVEGHAVVVWRPGLDAYEVAGLASRRTFPLRSSFRPTPNMAVNLVDRVGREAAHAVLESSFAQFQADRAVVGLARQVREMDEALADYTEAMHCDRGDFAEYAALRDKLGRAEKDAAAQVRNSRRRGIVQSLEALKVGDVIRVPAGRRAGIAVVLDRGRAAGHEGPRPTVLTLDRQLRRVTLDDLAEPVQAIAHVRVPAGFNPRNNTAKRDLASSVRNALTEGRRASAPAPGRAEFGGSAERADAAEPAEWAEPERAGDSRPRQSRAARREIEALSAQLAAHPCNACPDREQHARWGQRWQRLAKERAGLVRRVEARTNTLARTFDRLCEHLTELGYLRADADAPGGLRVTADGQRLRRIYTEKDLLVAECLRRGVWHDLDAAGLAALAAVVVYEARRETAANQVPAGRTATAIEQTQRIWSELVADQVRHRLDPIDPPDLGLAEAVHNWARGRELDRVLEDVDVSAGDFVRWTRQVVDLLGQIATACENGLGADRSLARTARAAIAAVDRGVVALGGGRA